MRISNMINAFALSAETAEKISQDVLFDISRFPSALKHMGIGMLVRCASRKEQEAPQGKAKQFFQNITLSVGEISSSCGRCGQPR